MCKQQAMFHEHVPCMLTTSLVLSPLFQNGCCRSEDDLGNCVHFLGAVDHNRGDQSPSCKHHTQLRYTALDLCYICDVLQAPGSGRWLFVARSTSTSVCSVKAVYHRYCAMS